MSVASLANTTITVQRATISRDNTGGAVETWAHHLTLKARVQPLSGAESQLYSRETEQVVAKAYIPGAPDVKHSDRVVIGSDTYIIRAVRNVDLLNHHTVLELDRQT